MRTDRAVAKVINNPGSGVLGVDHRLGSGECLRRDDEQSLLGRHVTERIDDVCGVDIGDEMTGDVRIAVGTQRLIRHRWTEVRAPDADIDNIGDALAGGAPVSTRSHRVGEGFHASHDVLHGIGHVLAVDGERITRPASQSHVQRRPTFGVVDPGTGEHRIDGVPDTGLLSQVDQRVEHGRIKSLSTEVEGHSGCVDSQKFSVTVKE